MQFGDREKKLLGYLVLVIGILVASYLGAYNGVPPLPPIPESTEMPAQAIPSQPGPPGDFVSMSQGGTYQDAVKVAVPTANATADIGLWVDNASVAQPFSFQDASTPVIEGYDGGGISIYAPTAVATGVPALKINNAGVSNPLEVQDGGTSELSVYNGGGVAIAAPTAVGTAVPALVVDNAGVSVGLEVRDASTPVFSVNNGGTVSGQVLRYGSSGEQIVCGTTTITGTGTLAHGLTTPTYCLTALKGDFAADTGFTSCAISGSTVTGKVWKVNATPTAADASVVVAWCVIGTP